MNECADTMEDYGTEIRIGYHNIWTLAEHMMVVEKSQQFAEKSLMQKNKEEKIEVCVMENKQEFYILMIV